FLQYHPARPGARIRVSVATEVLMARMWLHRLVNGCALLAVLPGCQLVPRLAVPPGRGDLTVYVDPPPRQKAYGTAVEAPLKEPAGPLKPPLVEFPLQGPKEPAVEKLPDPPFGPKLDEGV